MLSPIELALKPAKIGSKEPAVDFLLKHRDEIGALLGTRLPEDPGEAWEAYREKMAGIRKDYKELCYEKGEGKICLYQYKDISAKSYLRTPLLSAMRGAVVKWFPGGESVLLALPFPKFFNYGEVPETRRLPPEGFLATEKLDGTLVVAWRDEDGEMHFNTRGLLEWYGVVAGKTGFYTYKGEGVENPYVKAFINAVRRLGLWEELEALVGGRTTVMFELVGRVPASQAAGMPSFKVDPGDPAWAPYALARRDNATFELEYLLDTAFPAPGTVKASGPEELAELVKTWKDKEGAVLYYPGRRYREGEVFRWWNYLVKVKSPRYVLRAEISPGGRVWWRGVARYTILGMHDDLVSLLESREAKEFVEALHKEYAELRGIWEEAVECAKGGLAEEKANYLANNLRMRWILPYLEEGAEKGEHALRRLLIENMPKKKEAILSFVRRIKEKLLLARNAVCT